MSKRPPSPKQQHTDNMAVAEARISKALKNQERGLDLSDLSLTHLPESIGRLTHLIHLDISQNLLTELPETIGQLRRLSWLSAESNKLTALPESICRLTNLETLWLHYNQLTKLPDTFVQLKQLHVLSLGKNRFKIFPKCLTDLVNLKELYLFGNQLTLLPESIGKLTNLKYLYLDDNKLKALPEAFLNFKLEVLYLHNNRDLQLPTELLGAADYRINKAANPAEILDYYFRVRGGRRPLNEAKLILVGRGGVGKTSIVNRLLRDEFKDEKKTEGINITEWKLQLNNSEDVRLNIWDFGGQEIMHATHQFFLTQRSLYLLVLNGREGGEDADAEYWLKLIESFGDESPIIIVLNKIREHPFDVNRRALQQKYPAIRDVIKTDCEDGTGIAQLRKSIERETDRLEHLRDAFPASWFTIKDRLAGMRKNYLNFDEYRKECAKLGEKDSAAQESLAFYLHSLGIALNYRDDPRLQDTHVLNPHWVTNGIYKIINSEKLAEQKGVIWLSDLSRILDTRKYPANMHRFLFDLMRKFDLCFSFPDDDTHYLIPELLDKQEPPETEAFKPSECLNFQYHYPVLPEGLLPRFIVRTHVLSEGLPRWRTGVILQFEGCRALVKADVQDRKVFISVQGPKADRRRLLAIIRADFNRIHRDIRNLQPKEMVPVPEHPEVVVPYEHLLLWEAQGRDSYPVPADGEILDLSVNDLLNGVDIQGVRRKEKAMAGQTQAVRLFYSYSHKDEKLRNELETHLKLLQHRGLIETWSDRKIEAGDDWKRRIDENLERADIILLLISSDFIASDYCYEKEMKRALEREKNGEAQIIPVIVRDVNWKTAPFTRLQALPKNGKAVTTWTNKDTAWRNVSEGIEKVAEHIRRKTGR